MLKKLAFVALVIAAITALIRVLRPKPDFASPTDTGTAEWPPLDLPGPQTEGATAGESIWVEPNEDGSCPDGYPVKLKLSSGIFHVPGGLSYERTQPDRCYADAAAAAADGFRQSQR